MSSSTTSIKICQVEGCDQAHLAKGLCGKHYQRMVKYGDVNLAGRLSAPIVRILRHIDRSSGCWVWCGRLKDNGYATIVHNKKCCYVHRVTYAHYKGPIPADCEIDHLCRNRACCNPDHLEAVPHLVNMLRGYTIIATNAAKTHCPQGHKFTPENTSMAKGCRSCRTCDRTRSSARYYKQKLFVVDLALLLNVSFSMLPEQRSIPLLQLQSI